MNGISKPKAVLYLAAIFVAGLLTGAVGGYSTGKRSFYRPPPPEKKMAAHILEKLRRELDLTDEQTRQAEPLVIQCSERLRAIHEGATEEVLEVLNQTDRKLEEFLTPEQKQRLAQMQKQREEWFRKCRPSHARQKQ